MNLLQRLARKITSRPEPEFGAEYKIHMGKLRTVDLSKSFANFFYLTEEEFTTLINTFTTFIQTNQEKLSEGERKYILTIAPKAIELYKHKMTLDHYVASYNAQITSIKRDMRLLRKKYLQNPSQHRIGFLISEFEETNRIIVALAQKAEDEIHHLVTICERYYTTNSSLIFPIVKKLSDSSASYNYLEEQQLLQPIRWIDNNVLPSKAQLMKSSREYLSSAFLLHLNSSESPR